MLQNKKKLNVSEKNVAKCQLKYQTLTKKCVSYKLQVAK